MLSQRGAGRLGLVVWLAVMGAAVFTAIRCIPPRLAVMQLHDFADEQAKFAAVNSRFDQTKMVQSIYDKAAELGLPLEKNALTLETRRNEFILKLKHKVEIDLQFYNWVWQYDETYRHMKM